MYIIGVDETFVPIFDLEILAGRSFSREFATEDSAAIINEAAIGRYKFENTQDAIGKEVLLGGRRKHIIGVINNYNQMSLKTNIQPLIFPYREIWDDYFILKVNSDNISDALKVLQKQWVDFFPGNPFDHFFLDEFYNRQYCKDVQFGNVFGIFSLLAIFIACLGLFALVSYNSLVRQEVA